MQGNIVGYSYWPEILIGLATFVLSVSSSMFVAGMRWQEVRGDLKDINRRLATIEGMFTLVPRQSMQKDEEQQHGIGL